MKHVFLRNAEIAVARKALKTDFNVHALLTAPDANPKLDKNGRVSGILTAPLHLAPANVSGYEVCPMASKGCRAACLHTAGNPVYMAAKQTARINRTKAYFEARNMFMVALIGEIAALTRKAEKQGLYAGIRLNATSDIPFERVPVTFEGVEYKNIMELFPDVYFYDYTKRANRFNKPLPKNYHLTFSLSEDNHKAATVILAKGGTVATVFGKENVHQKDKDILPETFTMGGVAWPVLDGDLTDFRPDDLPGHIVGLKAKGDAKGDTSGFVQYGAVHNGQPDLFAREAA